MDHLSRYNFYIFQKNIVPFCSVVPHEKCHRTCSASVLHIYTDIRISLVEIAFVLAFLKVKTFRERLEAISAIYYRVYLRMHIHIHVQFVFNLFDEILPKIDNNQLKYFWIENKVNSVIFHLFHNEIL